MLRWTHAQFPTSTPGRSLWAGSGEDDQGSIHVVFYREATTGDTLPTGFPSERLLCHVLLAELPDAAMEEALESLANIWRYHIESVIATVNVPSGPVTINGGRIVSSRRSDPVVIAEG
jgi:hypothetical protein